MGLINLILFPLYTILFAIFFSWRRKRIEDPVLKKYHRYGFWIKVFGAFSYVIFSLFISRGDSTFLYYPEGINMARLILKDFSNIDLLFIAGKDFDYSILADTLNKGYFASESNFLIARIVTVLSFFTFGSYSVITLIFSMISFSGVWKLYKFFYEQYPAMHKQLAIAIIFLPNFVFWSSGILKDPLCTGMLGWFTYSMYKIIIKRKSVLKNTFVAIFSAYVLAVVKSYILFSYLPFFILFIVLTYFKNITNKVIRLMVIVMLSIFSMVAFYFVQSKLKEELNDFAIDKLTENVQVTQQSFKGIADYAESSFSLGVEDFDGSVSSLVKIAPAGIVATLFRPFLWESKKLSTLMSSLESLAIMLFTLYVMKKVGLFAYFGSIVKDPMIMFCMFFALVFALFVGVTTLNFGTLVRYKIPCVPFYIIAQFLILERWKQKQLKLAGQQLLQQT